MNELLEKLGTDWDHIEWFMKVNDEKYKKSIKSMKDGTEFQDVTSYTYGKLIERGPEGQIRFSTYTLMDNGVVFNHETYHDKDGKVTEGRVHCFSFGLAKIASLEKAEELVEKLLPTLDEANDFDLKY